MMKRFVVITSLFVVATQVWAAPQPVPAPTSTVAAAPSETTTAAAAPVPQEDPELAAEEAEFQAKAKAAQEKQARKEAKRQAKFDKMAKERGIFYTNGRMDYVKLVEMKDKLVRYRAPQHPTQIPLDKMKEYLASIIISEKNMLKKGPEINRVYNDKAVDFLAPIIVKAFATAQPNEEVAVSWLTKDPLFIIRNDRIVISNMWIQNGQLYVQFSKLLAKLVGDTDKQGTFNFAVNNAKGLRINLVSSGSVVVTNKHKNEVAINMAGDFSNVQTSDSVTAQDSSPKNNTVDQRLRDLDQLRNDKMITQAEYLSKRKQILDSL